MIISKKEYDERRTEQKTQSMAFKCLECGTINEIDANHVDGNRCNDCGGHLSPLGHLTPYKSPRSRPVHREAAEQEVLFSWAAYNMGRYPELELLHHIPNGGSRNKAEAANLKRQGVKSGVPDICLPVARGGYHGLYIEMKAGKNTTTENQKNWLTLLRLQKYAATVCYSWEEAAQTLEKYLEAKEN